MEKFADWLTSKFKHPLSPMFFFLGMLLILLGVSNGLSLPILNQLASDPNFRWACLVLGVLCFVASLFIFYHPPKVADASSSIADDRSLYQVHKYSGIWNVQTSFSRWRSRNITEPDRVSFVGKTLLVIPTNGEGGSGVQIGTLHIHVDNYHATYEIVNEVQRASVDKDETLRMHIKVVQRQLIEEVPPPLKDAHITDPYADLRGELENRMFDSVLKSVADVPNQLEGGHIHEEGLYKNQIASEKWVYGGLFAPPGF
jgi:hypothetical protein